MNKLPEDKKLEKQPTYFLIKINFRQSASIQGEIEWLNKDRRQVLSFRSFLELVTLISDALETIGYPDAEYSFRRWREEDKELK
ncbi:hypothetical protein I0Q91_11595 [Halanaerobiaceae bacterium Z-7014]|uniref:Uncharacterized protein n=1 Tax=Halonatronomonas betaini TaxID=2778430 RepID=A0A931FAL6_9FIRM|nr:hypothetical protein [Halonatronomonas betaini]MBF8437729.1 hypothetical protein [Halonatronomonas betaini]